MSNAASLQARLLALKRRLNDSASALQSERRFIAARALALEHRSDALTVRPVHDCH